MAIPDGPTADSLIRQIAAAPYEHDFVLAVRWLQALHRQLPRIGCSLSPAQDPVRFAQSPSLEFAPAALEKMVIHDDERAPVLYARHFGLFGPHGPLPLCLTEYAFERLRHHDDPTFVAFANVFHHRLMSFFFRATADARKDIDADRPDESHWASFVGSTIGLGLESCRKRDSLPDRAKLFYSGRLAQQTRNAEGLESLVQEFFGIRTEVQQFQGRWMDLPRGCELVLGVSPESGRLGVNAIVGRQFWHCQMAFRLRLGPMTLAEFERMLPSGPSFQRLRDWVRLYVGDHLAWDVQLVLARTEVPQAQLGRFGRLGWMSWLKTGPFDHDAEELIVCGQN